MEVKPLPQYGIYLFLESFFANKPAFNRVL